MERYLDTFNLMGPQYFCDSRIDYYCHFRLFNNLSPLRYSQYTSQRFVNFTLLFLLHHSHNYYQQSSNDIVPSGILGGGSSSIVGSYRTIANSPTGSCNGLGTKFAGRNIPKLGAQPTLFSIPL